MQSISGLITQLRRTTGERPPILLGASVTIVEDRVFVFAGADQHRRMTNNMYVLDIKTHEWTKLSWAGESPAFPKERLLKTPVARRVPRPRYFHSASVYKNNIVIFGGMCENKRTLRDVFMFDTESLEWSQLAQNSAEGRSGGSPKPRYAHLSTVIKGKLLILGGQTTEVSPGERAAEDSYVDEVSILDLETSRWVQSKKLPKRVGAYGSFAVTATMGSNLHVAIQDGIDELSFGESPLDFNTDDPHNRSNGTLNSPRRSNPHRTSMLSMSSQCQTSLEPNSIYLYTNHTFADVQRELDIIYAPNDATVSVESDYSLEASLSPGAPPLKLRDYSKYMGGSAMPDGLRFPTGHVLGDHIIMAGTYLTRNIEAYMVYALNVNTLEWQRIDTGTVLTEGSWNRGVLYENGNQYIVFGDRMRSLLDDYNHRYMNFVDMAIVNLEAFGIYLPPRITCSSLAQEMGLSLLKEPAVSDFQIITRDNQTVMINATVLRQRWPYFAEKTKNFYENRLDKRSQGDTDRGGKKMRAMVFPYPYDVVMAFLQYLYTDNLWTPLQLQSHILAQLLLLAVIYKIPRLRDLSRHMLHQSLDVSTAPLVFEAASLSLETSLQIRTLRMMYAAKKRQMQRNREDVQRQQLHEHHFQTSASSIQQRLGTTSNISHDGNIHHVSPSPSNSVSAKHRSLSPSQSPLIHRINTQSPKKDFMDRRISVDPNFYQSTIEGNRNRSFSGSRPSVSNTPPRSATTQPPSLQSTSPPPVPTASRSTGNSKSKSKIFLRAFNSKKTASTIQ